MNELATLGGFSLDLVEEPKQRPPIVRFKKGEYLTALVNDGQDDIRGALFAVALPTYRHTWTAWSSENKPLEDREAFLCFGEKPATADMLTRHPMRDTKDGPVDPWQEGLKMDGFLNVMDGWHPATFAVGSRTAIIAMQSAFSEIKKHQRTFPVSEWTPIWELKGGGKFKSEKFGDIHVPTFNLAAFMKADGTVKAIDESVKLDALSELAGQTATVADTFALPAPGGAPEAPQQQGGNLVQPPAKPAPAAMASDVDDDIPF